MKSNIQKHRDEEKESMTVMIQIYCHAVHKNPLSLKDRNSLCPECRELDLYVSDRLQKCPYIADGTKTFCPMCRTKCYSKGMYEKIRLVMKAAGPRMMISHPLMVLKHAFSEKLTFRKK